MYLDVGNQFGIISPTHDFKLVTRLQHVMSLTQYVRLVDGPTTIVCDTFQEIASGSVMSGICLSVC